MGPDLTRRRELATGAAVAGTAAMLGPLTYTASATDPYREVRLCGTVVTPSTELHG